MSRKSAPREALSVVSYLFLLVGVLALVQMIMRASQGIVQFNFGILGIGIFTGLRRYSPAWRLCALVVTWYGIATILYATFVSVYGQPFPGGYIMGLPRHLVDFSAQWFCIPLGMMLVVTFWQYRILTHPAVRRLFAEPPVTPHTPQTPEGRPVPPINGVVVK